MEEDQVLSLPTPLPKSTGFPLWLWTIFLSSVLAGGEVEVAGRIKRTEVMVILEGTGKEGREVTRVNRAMSHGSTRLALGEDPMVQPSPGRELRWYTILCLPTFHLLSPQSSGPLMPLSVSQSPLRDYITGSGQ